MSEHSEHYHDTERNKPLPGANVSSKEEVLQTLLDAARGEITALEEANKLLAAQVDSLKAALTLARAYIEANSTESGYGFYRPANPNDFFPDFESCSEEEIATHKAACEAFDKGEDRLDKDLGWIGPNIHVLTAPWGIGGYNYRSQEADEAIAKIDAALSGAAKVSARAADAPSEPSLRAELLEVAEACVSQGCIIAMEDWLGARSSGAPSDLRQALIDVGHSIQFSHDSLGGIDKMPVMMHHGGTVVEFIDSVLKSRAADALGSQPTEWNDAIEAAVGHLEQMGESLGDHSAYNNCEMTCCDSTRMRALSDAASAVLALKRPSSQPTDGEVRNG